MMLPSMNYRFATFDDCALLSEWNYQLIQDEGHRNRMSITELGERMAGWLDGEYRAVIFQQDGQDVPYVLYREGEAEIYLRQLFVARGRRRQGIGQQAFEILRSEIWPGGKRLTVDVLTNNTAAVAFWRSVGYTDYCLTLEILPET